MKLSIVVPCYNEELNIPTFYSEVTKLEKDLPKGTLFEFIFVNDGSADNTITIIKELSEKDSSVKYIDFSRNFGKEAAMLAGLEASSGDYVVVMDADLQDPPSLIPEMYELIKDGEYERIATRRMNRKGEPIIRSFFARQFYRIINKISNVKIVDGARDFSMMSRKMVNSVLSLKERSRFTKGIFEWPGYKTKWISFSNHERHAGNTKWSFWKLFAYSIEGIVSFSNYPLIISSIVGVAFCALSILMILVVIIRKLVWGDKVDGWPSLVCIILFVSGIQQLSVGIIGSYLSRIFTEVKNRPLYVVLDTNISSDKPNKAEAIK